jgi:hypothetical protein
MAKNDAVNAKPAASAGVDVVSSANGDVASLPDGYGLILFGDDKGVLKMSTGSGDARKTIREIRDVFAPIPLSAEAQEFAGAKVSTIVTTIDGKTHNLTGMRAVFASKWMHKLETIRGMAKQRTKDGSDWRYSDAYIRRYARNVLRMAGQEKVGAVAVSEDAVLAKAALFRKHDPTLSELDAYRAACRALGVVG